MGNAIDVEGLRRTFGSGNDAVVALSDVSFTVPTGQILALLGTNGAGKTTITKILSTLLLPTAGTARVLGLDVTRDERKVRACTSVVFGGDRGLYDNLSALDNLRYFAVLQGVRRAGLRQRLTAALEEVGIAHAANRRVETFSKGMRQRLHIAAALISEPRVLLLDEPTVGLDPVESERLRQAVAALRDRAVTVLLTSHNLLDVERLADRVMVLEHGRIAHDMSLGEFTRLAGHAAVVVIRGTGPAPTGEALVEVDVLRQTVEDDRWELRIRVHDWDVGVFSTLSALLKGATITDVQVEQVRLEDAFAVVAGGTR